MNATKTILIVKPEHLSQAQTLFDNTSIQITVRGQRHLGAVLGSSEFVEELRKYSPGSLPWPRLQIVSHMLIIVLGSTARQYLKTF